MLPIDFKMSVGQLLEQHPETASVFADNGINTTSINAISLERVLADYSIHPALFMGRLKDAIEEADALASLRQNEASLGNLHFVGKAAFYVKPLFCECMENLIRQYNAGNKNPVTFLLPKAGNHAERDLVYIWNVSDIAYFPDMVCAVGLSNLFRRDFYRKFIRTEKFTAFQLPIHPAFNDIGLENPTGGFTTYAVVPWIIMVDLRRLENRPIPQTWEDLLSPIYADSILVEGSDTNIANVLPLYIYRDYGKEGLRSFAHNVKGLMHPVNMIRYFDRNDEHGAAISIVPWTIAKACPYNEERVFIWPTDGALTVPMYFLVKQESAERMKFITEYLAGSEYGQKAADLFCPSLNPSVDNHLPENASFQWLGWDFIYSQLDRDLSVYTRDLFAKYWR